MNLGPTQLLIDVAAQDGVAVVTLDGPLDAAQAAELRSVVNDLLAQDTVRLILDVSRLDFVDSAGLAVIAGAARVLDHGGVVVRGAGTTFRRLLHITGLDVLVTMRPGG
jgi:anti-sigma B factor antagonist